MEGILEGMDTEIRYYDAFFLGTYRIELHYNDKRRKGKSGLNPEIILCQFLELVTVKKVVDAMHFEPLDPRFTGEMTLTTELTSQNGGTMITPPFRCQKASPLRDIQGQCSPASKTSRIFSN